MPDEPPTPLETDWKSLSPIEVRKQLRAATLQSLAPPPTSGFAPGFVQVNLLVLPSRYQDDFVGLCRRNPVACPLLAVSAQRGDFARFQGVGVLKGAEIAEDLDIRTDLGAYNVYRLGGTGVDGWRGGRQQMAQPESVRHMKDLWTSDHVAFLIGCSFSFEDALSRAGLRPRHQLEGKNVPMYKTTVPLMPSGVFRSSYMVVSMRSYRRKDLERAREITREYTLTHGEPVAWDELGMKELGITDLGNPDWGDGPVGWKDGRLSDSDGMFETGDEQEIPVFWACGVTPQEAVCRAEIEGVVMAHVPGHMLVCDLRDSQVVLESQSETDVVGRAGN